MIGKQQLFYLLKAPFVAPFLPLMAWQGKQIRKRVPRLPEATHPQGKISEGEGPPLVILGIGESTMAGVGVTTHTEGFMGSLASQLNKEIDRPIDWQVVAKSGIKAAGVSHRLLPKLPAITPDIIVIALGGNDAFALRSPKQWIQDIDQLIASLHQRFGPHTPLVFCNMPPIRYFPAFTWLIRHIVGSLVDSYSHELHRHLAQQEGVYFNSELVRLEQWRARYQVDAPMDALFSDGVHPAPLTYQLWGKDMAKFIQKSIF